MITIIKSMDSEGKILEVSAKKENGCWVLHTNDPDMEEGCFYQPEAEDGVNEVFRLSEANAVPEDAVEVASVEDLLPGSYCWLAMFDAEKQEIFQI